MRQKSWKNFDTSALISALLKLKTSSEARRFLRDLLTEPELIEFGNRWKVARMLAEGIPYEKIVAQTGMSSTTVARIQRWLRRGAGGYRLMLGRLGYKL